MNAKFTVTKRNMSVLNLNIRSLTASGDTFVFYFETLRVNFDFICITGKWQKVESLNPICFLAHSLKGVL